MCGVLAVSLGNFFRLIAAFIMFLLVLAACYFTTIWIGNFQKGKMGHGNIEVIEIHRITNNKYIEIVRIGKKYYIISVSKDHIEKIDTIEETDIELPEAEPVYYTENFSQILEKIKNIKHPQEKK